VRKSLPIFSLPLLAGLVLAAGCRKPVFFPAETHFPMPSHFVGRAFDVDADGKPEFFLLPGAGGRFDRIAYDRDGDWRADEAVSLDAIDFARCRHLVIILDGVGYDLVKEYRDKGGLRLFHPPSRVIAPYPTLTDVCMEDLLGYTPCEGFEAEYYDHRAGKMTGGSRRYLRGDNAPYNRLLHYRANLILDAVAYVKPWEVFGKEVNDAKRLFDKREAQEMRAYFVSSAGVGTRKGARGHRMCLERIEQLVHQIVWETRGLVKVTLLADHGHSYTPAKRVPMEKHLKSKGWRLTSRLRGDKDVAYIRFGLETYLSLAARRPAELAADTVACKGVELASYADGGRAVVLGRDGAKAVIAQKGGRFSYKAESGDPLKLEAILAKLKSDGEGFFGADELLAATVGHEYPAPLQRIWRAHFALVGDPADVIVSLFDEYYSGSTGFGGFVNIASTHGGLNRRNSTTFIMSTAGPLPPLMRSADVPRHMKALTGRDWPADR
jgi:hypothetical protein